MSDERHQTWNLWVAYGLGLSLVLTVLCVLVYGGYLTGAVLIAPPETCYAALAERPSMELQGYELRACQAAGMDLDEADAHFTERLFRPRTAEERAASARARAAAWARSFGAPPPYDRARFCATPGLSCLD